MLQKLLFVTVFFLTVIITASCFSEVENIKYRLEQPPKLLVASHDNIIEAMIGTTSWYSFEVDSISPTKIEKNINNEINVRHDSKVAFIFDEEPLEIQLSVRDYYDNSISVDYTDYYIKVPVFRGPLIVQISARWLEGNAEYVFFLNVLE